MEETSKIIPRLNPLDRLPSPDTAFSPVGTNNRDPIARSHADRQATEPRSLGHPRTYGSIKWSTTEATPTGWGRGGVRGRRPHLLPAPDRIDLQALLAAERA